MASKKGVGSAAAPGDDSDLEDLIAKSPGVGNKPGSSVEIDFGRGGASSSRSGGFFNPLGFITGSCRLCFYKFPRCSKCILFLLTMGFIAFLSNTVFSSTQKMGSFGADYSAITSAYDLSLSKVDHWCIQGDNDSCKCEDPLEPNSRSEFKSWNAAHKANVADVDLYRAVYGANPSMIDVSTGKTRPPIDVAFLGESVVEAMDGRWLGKRVVKAENAGADGREGPQARQKPDIGKIFERLFRRDKGGPVEGVALGVAGDNTANVLWRLQHDEMPYDFNPKVWWVVLGMNDLTRMQCSEEIVVLGILRIVEEIRLRKPDAHIVINSLLPMVNFQRNGNEQPKMADFADFRRDKGDAMRENMEVDKAVKRFFGDKGPDKGGNRDDGGAAGRQGKDKGKYGNGGKKKFRNLRDNGSDRKKRNNKKMTKKERIKEEDNADRGPALEKALERRKKMLELRDKHLKNKVFNDNEKYHPKKPISPFLPMIKKRTLPPVWPAVHLINDKLRKFCQKHDSITFFDATPIFATQEGPGRHKLHSELISPRGHPSELGFAAWEGNIMGRLHHLLMEKKEKPVVLPVANDDDDQVTEEDPEVERISSMKTKDSADEAVEGDGDEEEVVKKGTGEEEQSDGKENVPLPVAEQPSRDQPKKEAADKKAKEEVKDDEEEVKDDEDVEEKDDVKEEEEEEDDGEEDDEEEEEDDDDEEE